ncbi:MAG: topoisomerase [Gaiellales bacterium]|jgi:DNA topoisomerase-3|nr:topoisomerase [Gaiellales bacterium]
MGKTLVIAEKPSVGKDYAKALGGTFKSQGEYLESDDYVVSWAVGHLAELAEPEVYDPKYKVWSLNRLPIIPERFQLQPIQGRGKKQLDVLGKLAKRKDVDAIVNGCDAGREGELIFAYIHDVLGMTKPVRRLWVSSMTKDAIRDAFTHLRDGSEMANLQDAARSRGEADWLVGMNGTRAATKVGRLDGVVSLGRVQTPTLALIVRRDLEIDAFVPETYFQVDAQFALDDDRAYTGRWFKGRDDRTAEREEADRVAAAASGADSSVLSVKRTERKQRPPLLYDLTSLQREANNRFGMSAQRTLAAAQRLYEGSSNGAVITYPRTRSQFLPSDQIPTLKPIASSLAGISAYRPHAEYVTSLDVLPLARVVNDKKVDDHHAIIPTGDLPRGELSSDDRRIYDLVARRFLAVFHPEARFEDTEVVTEAAGERFRTKGKRLLQAGWRGPAFGDEQPEPERGEDDEREQSLPRIDEGERGRCTEAEVLEKQTKPPGRYSEASLLGAMETAGKSIDDEELRDAMKESGLGTPATRADTIERLLNVGYIEREGKALVSTPKGRQTIELLGTHSLTSAELTGSWEQRLSQIEHGDGDRSAFMADIAKFAEEIVDYFRQVRTEPIGACPHGDGDVIENRAAFGCSSYKSKSEPGCGFTVWKSQQGFTIDRDDVAALLANGEAPLEGPRPAKLVLNDEKQPQIVGEDGKPVSEQLTIGPCPNGDGDIRENRAAFGCTSYKSKTDPGCGFTIWKTQNGYTVTADDVQALLERGEAPLEGPKPAKLVIAEGNQPQIVGEDGTPITGEIGPCPNGDGMIRSNSRAFGCSSWKSKSEPGCGFTVWKSQKGFEITEQDVRTLLEQGEATLENGPAPGKLVIGEGNQPVLVGEDGKPLGRVPVVRETIATCPRCGGEIRSNSRAYGCSSWKSKKNPGCGFVIWKSTKGREITPDDARRVIADGATGPLEFRDRQGPFTGRLVLTDDKAVEVERLEGGSAEAAA